MCENSYYSRKSVIYIQSNNKTIDNFTPHCYFDVKSQYIKSTLKTKIMQNGQIYNSLKFKLARKENNYKLTDIANDTCYDVIIPYDLTDDNKAEVQLFSSLFMAINAFMFYGNITGDNHLKAVKQDTYIIFKVYDNKLYAIPTSKNCIHKSPEGIFPLEVILENIKAEKLYG